MSLAFYVDEHIPGAITEGLRLRGLAALTIQEDGRTGAADPDNLRRAFELRRVLVTEDHDYEKIATEFWTSKQSFYGIAFVLRWGVSFGALIDDLELLATCSELDEVINRITYIPLK